MGAIAFIAAVFLIMALAAPALADNNIDIPMGQSFYSMGTDVLVHLDYLEISDYPMGSTYSTTPLGRVEWVRLFYTYENQGSDTEEGYLQAQFIDGEGNVYTPDSGTYTGMEIQPHTTSSLQFLEIPVSKGSNITDIRVTQGFNVQDFYVPQANATGPAALPTPTAIPTPTPVIPLTATAAATATATVGATPSGSASPGSCLPFLPFALLSGIGGIGMVINRYGAGK